MKRKTAIAMWVCTGLAVSAVPRAEGFSQAPPVGASTGNAILYTVNPSGTITSTFDPTSGNPYDGFDDFTVGIQNLSQLPVSAITLNGPDIFGFDGDGQAAFTGVFHGPNKGDGAFGYQGPDNTFLFSSPNSGTVVFTTPLPPASPTGAPSATWWSMEGAPTSALFGNIGLDEQGHGTVSGITPSTFTGTLRSDPTGGHSGNVLVYNLPVTGVVPGDVLLFDQPAAGGPQFPSDVIRFDSAGHAVFYSIVEAGQNQLADTGLPGTLLTNTVSLIENADPSNPGVTLDGYVPTAGQPGFDPSGAIPSYTFISDAPVPEPASLSMLLLGVIGLTIRRRHEA